MSRNRQTAVRQSRRMTSKVHFPIYSSAFWEQDKKSHPLGLFWQIGWTLFKLLSPLRKLYLSTSFWSFLTVLSLPLPNYPKSNQNSVPFWNVHVCVCALCWVPIHSIFLSLSLWIMTGCIYQPGPNALTVNVSCAVCLWRMMPLIFVLRAILNGC